MPRDEQASVTRTRTTPGGLRRPLAHVRARALVAVLAASGALVSGCATGQSCVLREADAHLSAQAHALLAGGAPTPRAVPPAGPVVTP